MKRFNQLILCILAGATMLGTHAETAVNEAHYSFGHIGTRRMGAFIAEEDTAPPAEVQNKKKPKVTVRAERSPILQRETVYRTLFNTNNDYDTTVASDALDKDLEFLSGTGTPEANLLNRVVSTDTVCGEAMFAHKILNPTSDIATLKARQAAITALAENPELCDKLEAELAAFKEAEPFIFGYWQEVSKEEQKALSAVYFNKIGFNKLNTNATSLEAGNHGSSLLSICAGTAAFTTAILPGIAYDFYQNRQFKPREWVEMSKRPLKELFGPFTSEYRKGFGDEIDRINLNSAWSSNQKTGMRLLLSTIFAGHVAFDAYICWSLYKNCSDINSRYDLTKILQQRVMSFAQLVRSSDSIYEIIEGTPLATVTQSLTDGAYRTDDHEYIDLCNTLRTNTFNGSASKLSRQGRVLATHKHVEAQKASFVDMMMFIGELDGYLSAARLLQSENENGYCLVSYIADADQPVVALDKMWNPFIDADKAVANSVAFGTSAKNRNMILTGPNAGGKSTALKAITFSITLAQSYGIAPAKKMFLTPFTKICSYLNITDDLAQGNSLFKSEVIRAKKLRQTIKSCRPDEWVFSVVDELFTGTAADKGEAAARMFVKELAQINNSMCLFATHYPKITELEKDYSCMNMRVGTPEKIDGKLHYPFTLEKGIATVNVAADILEEADLFKKKRRSFKSQ